MSCQGDQEGCRVCLTALYGNSWKSSGKKTAGSHFVSGRYTSQVMINALVVTNIPKISEQGRMAWMCWNIQQFFQRVVRTLFCSHTPKVYADFPSPCYLPHSLTSSTPYRDKRYTFWRTDRIPDHQDGEELRKEDDNGVGGKNHLTLPNSHKWDPDLPESLDKYTHLFFNYKWSSNLHCAFKPTNI